MRLKTPQFGEMEVEEENIVTFTDGIIGFEEYKKYVLVTDKQLDPLYWLISLDDPEIEFPLLNPYLFFQDYDPTFSFEIENMVIFTIVTLKKDFKEITTNLRAPIIIDLMNKNGKQVILNSDLYHTHHKIFNIVKV